MDTFIGPNYGFFKSPCTRCLCWIYPCLSWSWRKEVKKKKRNQSNKKELKPKICWCNARKFSVLFGKRFFFFSVCVYLGVLYAQQRKAWFSKSETGWCFIYLQCSCISNHYSVHQLKEHVEGHCVGQVELFQVLTSLQSMKIMLIAPGPYWLSQEIQLLWFLLTSSWKKDMTS